MDDDLTIDEAPQPDDEGSRRSSRATGGTHPGSGTPELQPGTVIADRYRISGFLGKGGMGAVHRASDLELGQDVAIKVLPPGFAGDPEQLQRFRQEVSTARTVAHRNVCRVYDIAFSPDVGHFLTMEFIEGEDLKSLIRRIGRLPEDKGVEIARQLCAALHAVHDQGILHRDLKPANVMLDQRGDVRLTDFGIASIASDQASIASGTPAYMAPEQIEGREVTARSDLYALGLVLYEIFTGKPAIEATSMEELHDFHRHSAPIRLTTHVRDLDPAVERVIMRCLRESPRERPRTALEVSAALPGGDPLAAALAAGETPSPELVAAGEADSMPRPGAFGLFGLLVVVVVGLVFLSTFGSLASFVPTERPPIALRDKARDVLATLGAGGGGGDEAYGFAQFHDNLVHLRDAGVEDWTVLEQERPPSLVFWYRWQPRPFVIQRQGLRAHRAHFDNPPFGYWREVRMLLDLQGRLDRIEVVPVTLDVAAREDLVEARPDFEEVFALAGLDFDDFEEVENTSQWRFDTDEHLTWEGEIEGIEGRSQVLVGVREGRVVRFVVQYPWQIGPEEDTVEEAQDPDPESSIVHSILTFGGAMVLWVNRLWLLPAIGVAAVLGYRSIRDRRGDTRTAWIVALAAFTTMMAGLVLSSHTLFVPIPLLLQYMAFASFIGLGAWAAYVGIEPSIRRLWPIMLVSWTRLLSGRVFDPLVGRSLLFGLLAGASVAASFELVSVARFQSGEGVPEYGNFESAAGMRFALGKIAISLCLPLVYAFVQVIGLAALRALVRRQWVAVAIFFVLLAGADSRLVSGEFWTILISTLASGATVFLLLRYGVLSVIAMMLCDSVLKDALLTTDVSAWYFPQTVVVVVLILGIGLFGAFASSKGRPLFRLD